MKNSIVVIGIILCFGNVYSQEYGFLFKTKILADEHANVFSANIRTDTGDFYNAAGYSSNPSNVGDVNFDLVVLDNNFNNASVNLSSSWVSLSGPFSCQEDRSFLHEKNTFNTTNVNFFSECNFSSTIYTIHIDDKSTAVPVCLNDTIILKYGYQWQFAIKDLDWIDFPDSKNDKIVTEFTLRELLESSSIPQDQWKAINTVKFQTGYGGEYTNIVVYDVIGCSPDLVGAPDPINATCFGDTDGGVSLTFDGNIDSANGYEMRYFIYQGNPSSFPINQIEFATLPNAYADLRIPALTDNGDGTFSASSARNLEAGFYYIVYQEVKYAANGIDVTVKSGGITSQFEVKGRTKIETGIVSTTQPKCSDDKGVVVLSSVGGDNFGSGTLQYRQVGGPWQSSNTFSYTPTAAAQSYRFESSRLFGSGSSLVRCVSAPTVLVTINAQPTSVSIIAI